MIYRLYLLMAFGSRIGRLSCGRLSGFGVRNPKSDSRYTSIHKILWSESGWIVPKPVIPPAFIRIPGLIQIPSIGICWVFLLQVATRFSPGYICCIASTRPHSVAHTFGEPQCTSSLASSPSIIWFPAMIHCFMQISKSWKKAVRGFLYPVLGAIVLK